MVAQFEQDLPKGASDKESDRGSTGEEEHDSPWICGEEKGGGLHDGYEMSATARSPKNLVQASSLNVFPSSSPTKSARNHGIDRPPALPDVWRRTTGGKKLKDDKQFLQQTGNTRGNFQASEASKTQAPSNSKGRRSLSEEEKIAERNRKGRERSMRTRLRNASRLKNLQENCAHLQVENGVLRQIVVNMRKESEWDVVCGLLHKLEMFRRKRPAAYTFASKEAERAAHRGEGLAAAMDAQMMQGVARQTQPVSVTETNVVSGFVGKENEERGDTSSTNGVDGGKERGVEWDLDNDGELFAWLTDVGPGPRAGEMGLALGQVDALTGFSLNELEDLVGGTGE